MSTGGFNKTWFYMKGLAAAIVIGYFYFMGTTGFERFKEWAMNRKATKMIGIIETNLCFGDGKCSEAMKESKESCTSLVTAMRSDKNAPDFNAQDRRLAIGCMHKGFMAHNCSVKPDEKKRNDCLERVGKRHEKCFDFTWKPDEPDLPKTYGSGMLGCLYGVMFVKDNNAGPGINVETESLKKLRPKLHMRPIDPSVWPTHGEVNELKEHMAEMGEQRIDNFNEAMDALQEGRGGAAVDNAADLDVFDKSGKSALESAGMTREAAGEAADAHAPAPGEKAN